MQRRFGDTNVGTRGTPKVSARPIRKRASAPARPQQRVGRPKLDVASLDAQTHIRETALDLFADRSASAEAIAAFEAVAKREKGDKLLTDYAALQAATLRVGAADFTEIENRLTPLMSDTSPWRYSARELLGLAAFKAGKTQEARSILTPLFVDQQAPQSITERAQMIMAEIASGEIAKKATGAPAAGATPVDAKPADATAPPAKKD